jgi:hypothetical protein
MPTGMLTRKIHRQVRWSTKKPPTSGPATAEKGEDAGHEADITAPVSWRDDVPDDHERHRHQAAGADSLYAAGQHEL